MMPYRLFGIDRPLIMAHRGDSANFPENTMASMESAVKIGVDVLETDVHLTKDGEFVLFHDEDIQRTTGEQGTIRDRTLEELRQIDLGETFTIDGESFPFSGKGLRVLTLREVFKAFPQMRFNIDMKDMLPEVPRTLERLLREEGMGQSVVVASFHPTQAQRFHEIAPDIAMAANPSQVKRFVIGLKLRMLPLLARNAPFAAFQVPTQSGSTKVVDRRFIEAAHRRGIAVHVWTINERKEMELLLEQGVDGIFTDKPGLLREVMIDRGLL
jgi:glycerophosphoryl diester phosphodiesterase